MSSISTHEKIFRRGNGQSVSYSEMVRIIANYIKEDTTRKYEITVGTDSQSHDTTKMVEVIALSRIGSGGIFFYHTDYVTKIRSLKTKIVEETSRSLSNAEGLLDEVQLQLLEDGIDIDKLNIHFVIHCDIGHAGKTKELINEITGWVEASGYDCVIKPDSYTASGIANKISK